MALAQDLLVADKLRADDETQVRRLATKTVSGSTYTVTAEDYGKVIFFTYAGSVAVTLPAAAEPDGSQFWCINANSDTTAPTYSTPTSDELIAFNNATADSVTFGSGHRIGSVAWFLSNGTLWMVANVNGACTMTVTDT